MATTQKCVMIFRDGGAGWTESQYLTGVEDDPDASKDAALDLAKARGKLLSSGDTTKNIPAPYIEAVRVSDVARPQVSALFPAPGSVTEAGAKNPTGMMGTRTANVSLFTAGKLNKRILKLRGAPAAWLQGDLNERRSNKQVAGLGGALDEFKAKLKAAAGNGGRWAIRTQPWTDVTGGDIANVTVDNAGYFVVSVPGILDPIVAGDRVAVRGMFGRGIQKLNGAHYAKSVTDVPPAVTLNQRQCKECQIELTQFGKLQVPGDVTYIAIAEFVFSGYGQAKTGRRFFRPPGHRRKQRCRR